MSEEIFEKDDILTDEELDELEDVELDEEKDEEQPEEEEAGFGINIIKLGKWKKKQSISILDFSSLEGTVSSVLLITVIVLLVKYIKLKKRK